MKAELLEEQAEKVALKKEVEALKNENRALKAQLGKYKLSSDTLFSVTGVTEQEAKKPSSHTASKTINEFPKINLDLDLKTIVKEPVARQLFPTKSCSKSEKEPFLECNAPATFRNGNRNRELALLGTANEVANIIIPSSVRHGYRNNKGFMNTFTGSSSNSKNAKPSLDFTACNFPPVLIFETAQR